VCSVHEFLLIFIFCVDFIIGPAVLN